MEKKINFQKLFFETIEKIPTTGSKPTLLLHACCGPCFTIPYELLKEHFDITILFNNSNIYPEEEHNRRLNELKRYVQEVCSDIKIIEIPYDNATYNIDLEPMADQKEGYERCRTCFRKRLSYGYQYAVEHNFDYFGTVMTISRYKNAQDINRIGFELQNAQKEGTKTKWLPADFKKSNGYEKSLIIISEHKMYFQEYCGCVYSYRKKFHE